MELENEMSLIMKGFLWKLDRLLTIKDTDTDAAAIRAVFCESICLYIYRLRYFFRRVVLNPLGQQQGRWKVIPGGFDDGEKTVLRVTIFFLERINDYEKLTYYNLKKLFSNRQENRFSVKLFKKILYKTLDVENNLQKVIDYN